MASCCIHVKGLPFLWTIFFVMLTRHTKLLSKLFNNCCSPSCGCIVFQAKRIKISVFGLHRMVVWGSLIVKFRHLFSVKSCIANQSPKSYSSISCNFLAWIRNTVKCSIKDWKWKVVLHFRPDGKVFQMAFWKQNKEKIYSLTNKLLDSRYVYYFMKHGQEAILYL